MSERPADIARERIAEMLADSFGRQVLGDLVPRGARITPADPAEPLIRAVRVAMNDSHGLPAFLAVVEPGRDDVELLVVEAHEKPGWVRLHRPGDWVSVGHADPDISLAGLLAQLRQANEGES